MIEADKKVMERDDAGAEEAKQQSKRHTRRSFLVAGLGAAVGYEFFRYLGRAPQTQMLSGPLRKALEFNEKLSRGLFDERALAPTYPVQRSVDLRVNGIYGLKQDLALSSFRLQVVGVDRPRRFPQYVDDVTAWKYEYTGDDQSDQGHDTKVRPKDEGGDKDTNGKPAARGQSSAKNTKDMKPAQTVSPSPGGDAGKGAPAKPDPYASMPPEFRKAFEQMQKDDGGKPTRGNEEAGESDSTLDPGTPGLLLSVSDVEKLPFTEIVTQFKCIEGWSEIVHWGGYRMRDFIASYPPAPNAQGKLPKYVYMETPNGDFYTGYHLEECMHPQTLLATQMAGKPLSQIHGAPFRLHMPIKYGYKQIKRIGLIAYTDDKPDDYWTKLGYDWYAGL